LDFVLTNPGHYVDLEVRFSATRITTFVARLNNQNFTQFSSVIFSRADFNIAHLKNLKGKTLAAVNQQAFGGFQLAQDVLLEHDINVLKDMQIIWLGFPHADVVNEVLSGSADVGVVRSGVIEKMINQNKLNMSDIKVLNQKNNKAFPQLHSTDLFPEWPLAKLPETDDSIAKQVAVTLMQMPASDDAAVKAGGAGWTIPLDYTRVHRLLRDLKVAPYPAQTISIRQLFTSYSYWFFTFLIILLLSFIVVLRFLHINKKLRQAQLGLNKYQGKLEELVQQRTQALNETNTYLKNVVDSHKQAEHAISGCGKTMQELHKTFLRTDLDYYQRLNSIVEIVRQYLGAEVGLLSRFHNNEFEVRAYSPRDKSVSAPLSEHLAEEAIVSNQLFVAQNSTDWNRYIARPVFIQDELHCLFEFATSAEFKQENSSIKNVSTELSKQLLNLVSLWISYELDNFDRDQQTKNRFEDIRQRFSLVSVREKDVLALLVQGKSTKSMSKILNISTKTIEMHRAALIRKTGAKSSIEVVQLAVLAEIVPMTQ